MDHVSQELFDYAVGIYRQLHMYPELGFELPRTVALVAAELDKLGIPYTDRYGRCSLVGYIGNDPSRPTLALRADMDALPIHELVDVPFRSRNNGVMHACGHDSHTAILLAAAKVLKGMEGSLPCNVRLLFQPSEEGAVSGAKMMVENGCLEGVDAVICTHCETILPTGTIGYLAGPAMAACAPITLRFYGVTSHASLPEFGVDAVAMAVESYTALKQMVKEEAGDRPYIWSVGKFSGGDVHNVIPDLCTQEISFRFYDDAFAERVHQRILEIVDEIARRYGGSVELDWRVSTCPLINNENLVSQFVECFSDMEGVSLQQVEIKKSSEDFAWCTKEKPGMLFRYGIANADKGTTNAAHRPDFKIDEEAMPYAILAFVNFVQQFHL